MATLTRLEALEAGVHNLTGLEGATNLTELFLQDNHISDISPIAGLTNLTGLNLSDNGISDISLLVNNTGLGSRDTVDLRGNPLSYQSIRTPIATLQSRGVTVEFDDQAPPVIADINGDGSVNILDLVLVAGMFGKASAAPSAQQQVPETLTAVEVQGWLTDARALEIRDPIMKRGIMMLEQLMVSLTPTETELLANYPNPFNPETWIPYRLVEGAFVKLTIYNRSGQVVRTLEVGHRIAAAYESRSKAIYWDGRNDVGEGVASGVYFYTLSAGDYSATQKMVILK